VHIVYTSIFNVGFNIKVLRVYEESAHDINVSAFCLLYDLRDIRQNRNTRSRVFESV